jgi:hypothetical protein
MIRISMDTEASNKVVKEGQIAKLVQQTVELLKPEASYFTSDHGRRTAYFFCDLKESNLLPSIAEPWFQATNALIDVLPAMNSEELRVGLERMPKR